mgnify:CR=1 FL=1
MNDKIGLILFMGKRTEHAEVSIQKYVPEVVHIVTSEELRDECQIHLERWESMYDIRAGGVKAVDDLFEATAVGSLLNAVAKIRSQESDEGPKRWYVGLTGGTMHMAATAVYASILMDMQPFYVIRPPMGLEQMPNRDVLEFPAFNSIQTILRLSPEHLNIITSGNGEIKELVETGLPESMFLQLIQTGVIKGDEETMTWEITETGKAVVGFANTPLHMCFNEMFEEIQREEKERGDNADAPMYYIG